MADKPTVEWDEGNPPGSQEKSLGATRMREMRTQLREMLGEDHKFDSSGQGATWGYHNRLTFYVQTSDPIPDANTGDLYSKDDNSVAQLFWVDENNVIQLTDNGNFSGGMVGEVRIWSGLLADIPTGWGICDGDDGRPDLLGKFIRGVNTDATDPGTTGGSDTVTLVTANLPGHTHTSSNESSHTHSIISSDGTAGVSTVANYLTLASGSSYFDVVVDGGTHTHTANTSGDATAFDNRPAYLEEAFIIKT
jgi:microcystin-dependent protein